MLARCLIVSICSPDSFAFFIADVALGHPDKLEMKDTITLVIGAQRAPKPCRMGNGHLIRLLAKTGPQSRCVLRPAVCIQMERKQLFFNKVERPVSMAHGHPQASMAGSMILMASSGASKQE